MMPMTILHILDLMSLIKLNSKNELAHKNSFIQQIFIGPLLWVRHCTVMIGCFHTEGWVGLYELGMRY